MTLYSSTSPINGGIMSPFQGTTPGTPTGSALTQLPNGMPALVAMSLGLVPANALVGTINSVSVGGAQNIGGDPCTLMELLSSGNGNQANGGTAAGAFPASTGENQQYTIGLTAIAMTENGPTPVNVDTTGLAPVPGGVSASLVGLTASGFGG
jgi:hypothetical protein